MRAPSADVLLRLNRDDLAVISDLLLAHGLAPLAAKFIAAANPRASWRKYFTPDFKEKWGVNCGRDVEEGAILFVQRRSDGQVQEVRVGAIVEDNPRSKNVTREAVRARAALIEENAQP